MLQLNKNLDEVRGRIQGIKPQLSLREAFSQVRREESRKKVTLGTSTIIPQVENSALVACGPQNQGTDNRQRKECLYCEHCHKPRHTKETCWKIHKKPTNWKPPYSQNRGNATIREENFVHAKTNPFSKQQLEILKQLIKESQAVDSTLTIGTRSLAQKGNFISALSVRKDKLNSWFVNSRASDHMIEDKEILMNFNPCCENITIKIVDGSFSKVIRTGLVKVSKDLILNNILLMP